jgi:hypothetical protein
MNWKKGITRLFILGLVITPIFGLIKDANHITNYYSSMWDTKDRIIENLKAPVCSEIVKSNPSVFPNLNPSYTCSPLYIYWDDIQKYRKENGLLQSALTDEIIKKAISEHVDKTASEMRWTIVGMYLAGYLFVCVFLLISFFILRWIIKGFKS